MSFSGGVFSINTSGQPVVDGTTISASVFNALTADLATGLSTCILKDGTQTATAGIPFFAGTALLPGVYLSTDTTTGFFRPAANVLAVTTSATERARHTAQGYFKASNTGAYASGSSVTAYHELLSNDATPNVCFLVTHGAASSANQYGMDIALAGDPNDSTRYFDRGYGTTTERYTMRSNGGLANYQANNANLSDITTKPQFEELTDGELDKLEAAFVSVDWAKFKYDDQTHDDWNFGYSAQGVQRAFGSVAPWIVDVWNPIKKVKVGERQNEKGVKQPVFELRPTTPDEQKLCVYSEDLKNIGNALLARIIRRVQALEAR